MSHHPRGMAICYAAIFLLSLNGLFSNSISLDSVSITQIRSVIAAFFIFAFCYWQRRTYSLARRDILPLYGIGCIMGLHWVTFFYSMQVSGVAIGMLALYTYPMMIVFLEPLFSRQRLQVMDVGLALVVLVGIAIMAYDELRLANYSVLWGGFIGVISALLFAIRNLLQKYHLKHISSETSMLHQLIAIALMLLVFVDYSALPTLPQRDVVLLLLLGLLTTATAHTLLVMAFKYLPAKTVAMIGCLQPVLGAFFAWLVLGEIVSIAVIIGGAVILAVAVYESVRKSV